MSYASGLGRSVKPVEPWVEQLRRQSAADWVQSSTSPIILGQRLSDADNTLNVTNQFHPRRREKEYTEPSSESEGDSPSDSDLSSIGSYLSSHHSDDFALLVEVPVPASSSLTFPIRTSSSRPPSPITTPATEAHQLPTSRPASDAPDHHLGQATRLPTEAAQSESVRPVSQALKAPPETRFPSLKELDAKSSPGRQIDPREGRIPRLDARHGWAQSISAAIQDIKVAVKTRTPSTSKTAVDKQTAPPTPGARAKSQVNDRKVETLVSKLRAIFRDVAQYKRLLGFRDSDAQKLLDSFQWLLDIPGLDSAFKRSLIVATQRLSQKAGLYPKCYNLHGVEYAGDPMAAGSYADVYKGSLRGQPVCIKVIRIYQTTQVENFLKHCAKEAILWGQLSHPNLLPIYGLYRHNSRICLVSAWMEHGDINSFLVKYPHVNRRLLISDVTQGLLYLHKNQIIHGDLKGANILVSKSGRVRLADFGLSSVSDADIPAWTSHSSAASKGGSMRWQAPELFDLDNDEFVHNSEASDMYAWSCVAYEVFTGNVPFAHLRDSAVLLQVKAGQRPSRPPESDPTWGTWGLTEDMWSLMQDCWKGEPAERPTVEQVISRLSRFAPKLPRDRRPVDAEELFSGARFREKMRAPLDVDSIIDTIAKAGPVRAPQVSSGPLSQGRKLEGRPTIVPLRAVNLKLNPTSTTSNTPISANSSGRQPTGNEKRSAPASGGSTPSPSRSRAQRRQPSKTAGVVPVEDTRRQTKVRRTSISDMVKRYEEIGGGVELMGQGGILSSRAPQPVGKLGSGSADTQYIRKANTDKVAHASPVSSVSVQSAELNQTSPAQKTTNDPSSRTENGPSPERPYQGVGKLIDQWQRKTREAEPSSRGSERLQGLLRRPPSPRTPPSMFVYRSEPR